MLNPLKCTFVPLINAWGRSIERKRFYRPPIVIGGCGRSGTTMLLAVLAAHPSIFAFPNELSLLNYWETDARTGFKKPLRRDRMYRYLISHRIPGSAKRWCEKTPANIRHIQEMLEYFDQEVCIIHLVRDARDVLISKHPDKPGAYWVSPERWIEDVKAGLAYEQHPCVLTIRYEDLVNRYRNTMTHVCGFIGEKYVPELDAWHQNTNVRSNQAWNQEVQPLHARSVGKWKAPENQERVQEIMQYQEIRELLQYLHYPIEEEV